MNQSHTVSVFQSQPTVSFPSPQKRKVTRLKSLQSIKIRHKGLPPDFFTQRSHIPSAMERQNKIRSKTLPDQPENIRKTPTFKEPFGSKARQSRGCRSEQRSNLSTDNPQGKSLPLRNQDLQITFSKQIFSCQERRVFIPIKKIEKKSRKDEENEFKDVGVNFLSPMKNEISQIMKRKHLNFSKYPYWFVQRGKVNHQNRLPDLKGRFPSAFGI